MFKVLTFLSHVLISAFIILDNESVHKVVMLLCSLEKELLISVDITF